jgi:hypothetical protein
MQDGDLLTNFIQIEQMVLEFKHMDEEVFALRIRHQAPNKEKPNTQDRMSEDFSVYRFINVTGLECVRFIHVTGLEYVKVYSCHRT